MVSGMFDSLRNFLRSGYEASQVEVVPQRLTTDEGRTFHVEAMKRGGMGIVYLGHFSDATPGAAAPAATSTTAAPPGHSPEPPSSAPVSQQPHKLALKTLDDRFFFDVQIAIAMQRETQLWMQLGNVPGILPLLSTGTIASKPYLLMPAVEPDQDGIVSVADAILKTPSGLASEQCVKLALGLAIALSDADKRVPGIIHGDIKPHNILLLNGLPRLTDFGLSRLSNEPRRGGTAPYMAPELWDDGERTTQQSDIYAYGMTLFEAIAGHLPFQVAAGDRTQWATLHQTHHPSFEAVPPSPHPEIDTPLRELALQCLAKQPRDRPANFEAIKATLLAVDSIAASEAARQFNNMTTLFGFLRETLDSVHLPMKLPALLKQGHYQTALELVEQLPAEKMTGKLLWLAGSTYSLNNQDEKALSYFQQYLATQPSQAESIQCRNEVGLSLRRLQRLQEAEQLYEQLIQETNEQDPLGAAVRCNHAGVLLDAQRTDEGLRQLERLRQYHPDSSEIAGLYGQALEEAHRLEEAAEAFQRAALLDPRQVRYYVSQGAVLFQLQQFEAAQAALDVAHQLGHHSTRWMELTAATALMLNQQEVASEWLVTWQSQLSKADWITVTEGMIARVQTVRPGSPSVPDPDPGSLAPTPPRADPGIPLERPIATTVRTGMDAAQRAQIRSGQVPFFQLRNSAIDQSFNLDFYYSPDAPDYVATFSQGYQKNRWQIVKTYPGCTERQHRYRFARCQQCQFPLLTVRDEGEPFTCQACGHQGPVTTDSTRALETLALQCEAAIGRKVVPASQQENTVFVAFWPDNRDQAAAIAQQLPTAGFTAVSPDAVVMSEFRAVMMKHNRSLVQRDFQVWVTSFTPNGQDLAGSAPAFVDRIIRDLRRHTGSLQSSSMVLDDPKLVAVYLSEKRNAADVWRQTVGQQPQTTFAKMTLVFAEIAAGRLTVAKQIAAAMELANPEDVYALRAAARVAQTEGRHQDVITRLEKVVATKPQDILSRFLLGEAYRAIGNPTKADDYLAQCQALGGGEAIKRQLHQEASGNS